MSRPEQRLPLRRAVTALALGLSVLVGVAPPAGYYVLGRQREMAALRFEAASAAEQVSELASRRPDLWKYEALRLEAMLVPPASVGATGPRRLVDAQGTVLAAHTPPEVPQFIAHPLRYREAVYDSGHVVGHVEVERSLDKVVSTTINIGLLSAVLSVLSFLAFRSLPMRLLRRAIDRAAHLASYDALTGLPNRTLFFDRLQQAAARSRRNQGSAGVLCLDLDHFKDVNDTLGHAAGDRLLVQVAARLKAAIRETDTVARLGGDEFAILQIGASQPEDAEALARRLIALMAEPFDLDGHQAVIGTSVGIALEGNTAADPAWLLREADLALYQAKAQGRGTYSFFEAGMNERLLERKQLEADLRTALETGQFRLHYQPQVEFSCAAGGEHEVDLRRSPAGARVVGAEALIRWRHPDRGNVPPDKFIPLAEATGLIVPIGAWVLREACRVAAGWPGDLRVAVNVSATQFRQPDFLEQVEAALRDSGLAPTRLELEVTEGVLMTDTEVTLATLERLRSLGVRLAMDDFGTGYSSLGYLRRFRFDKIKIDRSFVQNLGEDADADAIVRAVVGMGQAMGMRVNAEGVESQDQVELLRGEGCGEMQGYLFGRPMPPDEFEASLQAKPAPLVA